MKSTPGPWSTFRNLGDNLDAQYCIVGPIAGKPGKQYTLAEIGGFTEEEAEANALLIATLPDLLGALRKIENISRYPISDPENIAFALETARAIARRALANVEGEENHG